jgi:dTDP-glucose pyrophosphorylase
VDEIVFVSSPDKELMKKIILDFFPQYVSKITFINDNTHKGLDNSIMLAKEKCQNADATILC